MKNKDKVIVESNVCFKCGDKVTMDVVYYCKDCDESTYTNRYQSDIDWYHWCHHDHEDHNIVLIHKDCWLSRQSEIKAQKLNEYREQLTKKPPSLKFIPHLTQFEVNHSDTEYPDYQDGSEHDMIEKGNYYLFKPSHDKNKWETGRASYYHYGWSLGGHQLDLIEGPIFEIQE